MSVDVRNERVFLCIGDLHLYQCCTKTRALKSIAHRTEVHLPHWQYCLRLRLGNLLLRMLRPIILKVQQYEKSVGEVSITFANRLLFHTLSSWAWANRFLVFQNDRMQESLSGRYVSLLRYVQR